MCPPSQLLKITFVLFDYNRQTMIFISIWRTIALRASIVPRYSIVRAQPLNHPCLASKALALFQLPGRGTEAVTCMDADVRTCVSSSANLEITFYVFTNGIIHNNTLESKTIRRDGAIQSTYGSFNVTNR
ncbi:hypothetical protein PHPALM_36287 [Phytophthora palmivora]|uniref:Uncharacterized protein n=1 Tax=Phytophthora palmivora TaxID=4796 RepID=A0A2P4X0B4_9STRA|nr:hypothetical protein PHPALM_36287 [Phytophthora palmivora]